MAQSANGINGIANEAVKAAGSQSADPFSHATPEGAGKKMSEVVGEIVWLMSQSWKSSPPSAARKKWSATSRKKCSRGGK